MKNYNSILESIVDIPHKKYKILDDINIKNLENEMNKLAKEGWEFEKISQTVTGTYRDTTIVMSKIIINEGEE